MRYSCLLLSFYPIPLVSFVDFLAGLFALWLSLTVLGLIGLAKQHVAGRANPWLETDIQRGVIESVRLYCWVDSE
jgi:hypothetical protein